MLLGSTEKGTFKRVRDFCVILHAPSSFTGASIYPVRVIFTFLGGGSIFQTLIHTFWDVLEGKNNALWNSLGTRIQDLSGSSLAVVRTQEQGSRKMGTVGTCSQPIWDFGSHFWPASCNSFRNKCPPAKMSYRKWWLRANYSKSPKKMREKSTVIWIFSLKTTNVCFLIILETAHSSHYWSVPSQFQIFWSPVDH